MNFPTQVPLTYSNPQGNLVASGLYRSYLTQDIANDFPQWMRLRDNNNSTGQQFIASEAILLEWLESELEYNIRSKFLQTSPLDDIDVLYRVKVPSTVNLLDATASGIRCIAAPYGYSLGGENQIQVKEVTLLEDFYYNMLPTRLEIVSSGNYVSEVNGTSFNLLPSGVLDKQSKLYDRWKIKHDLAWCSVGTQILKQDARSMETYESYSWNDVGFVQDIWYKDGFLWCIGDNDGGIDHWTQLLLHLNDDTADYSSNSYTVTDNNIVFSNSFDEFPGFSAYFNGSSSYMSVPFENSWVLGNNDFTYEAWIYPLAINNCTLIGQYIDSNNYCQLIMETPNTLTFQVLNTGIDLANYIAFNSIAINEWQHIVLVRRGSMIIIFVNGISQSLSVSQPIDSMTYFPPYETTMNIGQTSGGYFNGYMQEVRIDNGVARWTTNFTPPTAPYFNQQSYLSILSSKTQIPSVAKLDYLARFDFNTDISKATVMKNIMIDASGYMWAADDAQQSIFGIEPRYDYFIFDPTTRSIYFREDYSNSGVFISNT